MTSPSKGTDTIAGSSAEIGIDNGRKVDAALAGLEQGEFVTIPSLSDVEQW
jgi:hypothetical protein